jgi:hypothetical protein
MSMYPSFRLVWLLPVTLVWLLPGLTHARSQRVTYAIADTLRPDSLPTAPNEQLRNSQILPSVEAVQPEEAKPVVVRTRRAKSLRFWRTVAVVGQMLLAVALFVAVPVLGLDALALALLSGILGRQALIKALFLLLAAISSLALAVVVVEKLPKTMKRKQVNKLMTPPTVDGQ